MIDPTKAKKKSIVDVICGTLLLLVWLFTPFFTDPITYGIIFLVSAILITVVHSIVIYYYHCYPPFIIYVYDKEEEE